MELHLRYYICSSFRGIILFLSSVQTSPVSIAQTSTTEESSSATKSFGATCLTINFSSTVDAVHDKNLSSFAVTHEVIGFTIAVVLMGCLALFIRKYRRREEIQTDKLSLESTLIYTQKESEPTLMYTQNELEPTLINTQKESEKD